MTTNKKIIIILIVVVLLIAAAVWYYFAKVKNKNVIINPVAPAIPAAPAASTNNSAAPAVPTPDPTDTFNPVGQAMYAIQDNVAALWISDASTFKVYNTGAFIGVCEGYANLGGVKFYTYANNEIAVAQRLVTFQ